MVASLETIKKLNYILVLLDDLWELTAECKGNFRISPASNPDFQDVESFVKTWEPISTGNYQRLDLIKDHIHNLRDLVKFSDFAMGFQPLLGYGYKYDPRTNVVTCHRYRHARELINRLGNEIKGMIDDCTEAK